MKGKLKISAVRKILWGVLGVIVLALVLGFVGVFSMQMAIEIAIMLGVVYTAVKLLFWRCPHCGRLLGGLRLSSKYCYYCEEKIED